MNSNKNNSALSSEAANLAKVIATFSVVLTHSFKLFKYMGMQSSETLYLRGFHAFASCGVPVFFLLSGYFLTLKDNNWDYRVNLKKKIRSLVVPYCFFILLYALISFLGSLALPAIFDDFREFSAKEWFDHFVGIPFVTGPSYYGPLWFLRDLFLLNVLSFVLVPVVKRIPSRILIPAMVVIYFMPLPQLTRYSIPVFATGMKFGFNKKIPINAKSIYVIALGIIAFISPIIFDGKLSYTFSVFLMTALVLIVSGKLINRDSIKEMVKIAIPYSFPIYLLHEYPMSTIMRLLALKHISMPLAVVALFVAPVLVICMCVFVITFWKRLSPKTYALFTGGR